MSVPVILNGTNCSTQHDVNEKSGTVWLRFFVRYSK